MASTPPQYDSSIGCLVHVFWMMFGNVCLFLLAALIYQRPRWPLSWLDVAFLVTVVALIVARWLDMRVFHGATASGEPATMAHFRRYVCVLIPLAFLIWGAVHFLPKILS